MYAGSISSNAVTPVIGMKNKIINGAMVIDQRNAGASVTPTANPTYTLDRWLYALQQASKMSIQQSTTAPTGFNYSLLATSLSAYTPLSSDYHAISQRIEGFNMSDFAWGTASAVTVTLSFWVRSSLTGTFSGSIVNSAADRSYPFTFVINSANTFEQKTVTIAGDTSGTWLTTNGIGARLFFSLGTGSTYLGTAGAWAGSFLVGATGSVQPTATNGATFYITGVQLEVGSTATSFDYRPYGTELALCQRYYYSRTYGPNTHIGIAQAYSGDNVAGLWIHITNQFRANPTLVVYPSATAIRIWNSGATAATGTTSGSYTPSAQAMGGIYWDVARSGGGLTAGNAADVITEGSSTVTFGLSAEL
jgi:hypothetical protein